MGELAAQNAKVKVTSPANTMERRFSVWLGQCSLVFACLLMDCSLHAEQAKNYSTCMSVSHLPDVSRCLDSLRYQE